MTGASGKKGDRGKRRRGSAAPAAADPFDDGSGHVDSGDHDEDRGDDDADLERPAVDGESDADEPRFEDFVEGSIDIDDFGHSFDDVQVTFADFFEPAADAEDGKLENSRGSGEISSDEPEVGSDARGSSVDDADLERPAVDGESVADEPRFVKVSFYIDDSEVSFYVEDFGHSSDDEQVTFEDFVGPAADAEDGKLKDSRGSGEISGDEPEVGIDAGGSGVGKRSGDSRTRSEVFATTRAGPTAGGDGADSRSGRAKRDSKRLDADFMACVAAGMSLSETARELKISNGAARYRSRKLGAKPRRSYPSLGGGAFPEAKLRELWSRGLTPSLIAAELGMDAYRVSRHLRRLGLKATHGSLYQDGGFRNMSDEAFVDLVGEGLTESQIASRLGAYPGSVGRRAKRLGLTLGKSAPGFFAKVSDGEFARLAADGLTASKLSDMFEVGRDTVRKRAKRLNIDLPREDVRRGPPDTAKRIAELAGDGLTAGEIARRLGVSSGYVHTYKRRLNIEIARERPPQVREIDMVKALALRDKGYPLDVAARNLGVRAASLRRRLRREGVPWPAEFRGTDVEGRSSADDYMLAKKAATPSNPEDAEIIAAVKAGLTVDEAASRFELSRHALTRRAGRLGLEFKIKRARNLDGVSDQDFTERILGGMTAVEVSHHFGMGLGSVYDRAGKLGLSFRRPPDSLSGIAVADDLLAKYVKEGLSVSEIARKVGCPVADVRAGLERLGLKVAERSRKAGRAKPVNPGFTDDELRDLVAEGLNRNQIALRLGVSHGMVSRRVETLGLAVSRKKVEKPIPATDEELRRMVDEGVPVSGIASRLGVNQSKIRARLRKIGAFPARPYGRHVSRADRERVEKLAADGLSSPEIARALDVPTAVIHAAAKKWGIRIISAAERERAAFLNVVGELRKEGISIADAAERLGMKAPSFRRRLKRLGVEWR